MTRDETQYRPAELIELLRSDVLALVVILSRHRLSTLERATVAAIAERHGHALPSVRPEPAIDRGDHLVRSLVDDPARIRADDPPELIAELARL